MKQPLAKDLKSWTKKESVWSLNITTSNSLIARPASSYPRWRCPIDFRRRLRRLNNSSQLERNITQTVDSDIEYLDQPAKSVWNSIATVFLELVVVASVVRQL